MDFETVSISKQMFVDKVIEETKEYGVFEEEPQVGGGPRGPRQDVEWDLDDVGDWTVDVTSDGNVDMHGVCKGEYSVKVTSARYNPPGKAHPAEYEWREVHVGVTIHVDVEVGEVSSPARQSESADNPPDGHWDYTVVARCE